LEGIRKVRFLHTALKRKRMEERKEGRKKENKKK